jgi:hypothetical protein
MTLRAQTEKIGVKTIKTRSVTESMKKHIAGKQFFKCANNLCVILDKLEDYQCPLWEKQGQNQGSFDQSGYEIDHVKEFAITFDDSEENLQALCKSCHSVKTKKFQRTMKRTMKKKEKTLVTSSSDSDPVEPLDKHVITGTKAKVETEAKVKTEATVKIDTETKTDEKVKVKVNARVTKAENKTVTTGTHDTVEDKKPVVPGQVWCGKKKKYGQCRVTGPYNYGKGNVYRYKWSCCGIQAKTHG